MFKKLLQRIIAFFTTTAEVIEMERYLSGATTPADLEDRMRRWERRHMHDGLFS